MDIGSILVLISLTILVGLFISRPFFEKDAETVSEEEHEYSSLLAERDRILSALQELDFDNILGKVPEEEYPAQRASLMSKGTQVLRRLDEIEENSAAGQDSSEERIEAAIRARKQVPAHADDELEALIASRKRGRDEKTAGFCPKCGNPLKQVDKFCSKCGANIPAK